MGVNATSVPKILGGGGIPPASTDTINFFNSVSSVASSNLTTILTRTVPVGKTLYLSAIEFGGENIARYDVIIDGNLEGRRRTYFSGPLSDEFFFDRFRVTEGKVVELKVYHERPEVGDFEGRIIGQEK